MVGAAHVGADDVELSEGDVVDARPRPRRVARGEHAAVVAENQIRRLARIDPQRMMVTCTLRAPSLRNVLPASSDDIQRRAQHVDAPIIGRVDANLTVVQRSRIERVDFGPFLAAVVAAIKPDSRRCYRGIDH